VEVLAAAAVALEVAWVAASAAEEPQVTGDREKGLTRTGRRRPNRLFGIFRWMQHMWIGPAHVSRAISRADFLAIEQAIFQGEQHHLAEVRFAVESSLNTSELWHEVDARARALDVFSHFRMWDTEDNNGVLIYVLWADHAVELVADRGADALIDDAVWQEICDLVSDACANDRPVEGVLSAIAVLNEALARAFPADGSRRNANELSNTPIFLR
jgi:uncharacterized membrane protein